MRRRLFGMAARLLLVGTAGCSTYSYLDLDIKYSPPGFTAQSAFMVRQCHMFVTGAVKDDFPMTDANCTPPMSPVTLDAGKIRYSTFTESGAVTFTLKSYFKTGERPECQAGEGTTTLNIAMGKTVSGDLNVMAKDPFPTDATCQ